MLAGLEIVDQPRAVVWFEGLEAVERGPDCPMTQARSAASVGCEANAHLAPVERPCVGESRALQLMHEVSGGLTGDEESTSDLAGMELVDAVQQFHDLELREGDAELEELLCETSAQDPVDASFGIDQPTGGGSLPLHDVFLPRGGDTGSGTPLCRGAFVRRHPSGFCLLRPAAPLTEP